METTALMLEVWVAFHRKRDHSDLRAQLELLVYMHFISRLESRRVSTNRLMVMARVTDHASEPDRLVTFFGQIISTF